MSLVSCRALHKSGWGRLNILIPGGGGGSFCWKVSWLATKVRTKSCLYSVISIKTEENQKCRAPVCPVTELTEKAYWYEVYFALLPIYTVTTAVIAMCEYYCPAVRWTSYRHPVIYSSFICVSISTEGRARGCECDTQTDRQTDRNCSATVWTETGAVVQLRTHSSLSEEDHHDMC